MVPGFSLGNDTTAGANQATAAAQVATNFSAYAAALTAPDRAWATAAPLTLTATSLGFVQSGGQAVAATPTRTIYGTKVLRKVVNATPAGVRDAKNPDEVDNGDGTITVRIALSQRVYATDTGLSLTVTAGWRTGMGAQTIAVTNTSTIAAPAPIVRWSDIPYQRQTGLFWLECVVASFHPNGLMPVAGVKFTVTDGTTIKTFWATALTNSPAFNPAPGSGGGTLVPPRVYAVQVDASTATALTQGLLRCDFKVFPWIGPAQCSDTADTNRTTVAASNTPSMTGLGTAALATSALVPFVVAWDPAGTWLPPRYIDIDEVNGTTTPANVTIATSYSASPTGTAAASITTALSALYAANLTVAAANGQAAVTRSADGAVLTIRQAGSRTAPNGPCTGVVNGTGSVSASVGITTGVIGITVRGDPADTTQRACILRSPATAGAGIRITRVRFTALSVEAQTNGCCNQSYTFLDNVEVRSVAGQSATSGNPFGATLLWAMNGKWWQHGSKASPSGSGNTPILVRSLSVERDVGGALSAGCARLPTAVAGTPAFPYTATTTDAGWALERIAVGNDMRFLNGANMNINHIGLNAGSVPAAFAMGTTYPATARIACINNVGEAYGASATLWAGVGENTLVVFTEVIIEGNTLTGDRTNNPYGTGADVTLALTDASTPFVGTFRFANNITMKNASKQDRFTDPGIINGTPNGIFGTPSGFTVAKKTWGRAGIALGNAGTRNWTVAVGDELVIAGSPAKIYHCSTAGTTAASGGPTGTGTGIADGTATWDFVGTENRVHGYRPSGIGCWPSHYGVGYEGNIDFQQTGDAGYDPEFFFEFYGIGSAQLSQQGVTGTTDPYTDDHSGVASSALTMQAASPKNGGGNYRPLGSGGGAYILGRGRNGNSDVDVAGVARGATFAAGALQPAGAVALTPAGGREASAAGSPAVQWTVLLGPAPGRVATRAAAGAATLAATCAAAASRLPTRAAAGSLAWTGALQPAATAQPTRAAAAIAGWNVVLPPAVAACPTRAGATSAGWSTTLAAAAGVEAQVAASPGAAWQALLGGDPAVMAMRAATPLFSLGPLSPAPADGRLALVDTLTPPPLSAGTAPPERTLVVGPDPRTLFIA